MTTSSTFVFIFIGFFLLLQAISPIQASSPSLVLGGGNLSEDNGEIWNAIIDLAGGPGVANIGIITAASIPESWDRLAFNPALADNSKANAIYFQGFFSQYGANSSWIEVDVDHLSNTNNATYISSLSSYNGFFFGGGDQNMLVYCLGSSFSPSPLLNYIQESWSTRGLVIGGTSAGTMSQVGFDSQGIIPMIAGGESWYAFTQGVGVYAKFAFQDQSQTAVTMSPYGGLGSFSFGLLDTHFSQRGRQGRAIAICWTQSSPRVFGIDENTALIVTNATSASDVNMRVVGEYGVSIFDLQGAYELSGVNDPRSGKPLNMGTGASGTLLALMNVSWTYLTDGDNYNPTTQEIVVASTKKNIEGIESRDLCMPSGLGSIFSSMLLTSFATDLLDSRFCTNNTALSYENDPLLTIQLREEENTVAWKGMPGEESNNYQNYMTYSWQELYIDVFPSFYVDTAQGP